MQENTTRATFFFLLLALAAVAASLTSGNDVLDDLREVLSPPGQSDYVRFSLPRDRGVSVEHPSFPCQTRSWEI